MKGAEAFIKITNHQEMFDKMDLIICGDHPLVSRGKPSPDIYLLAAGLLGVAPEECLVFEDALAGVQAAVEAGMSVVGCPDPRLPPDPFLKLTPHLLSSLDLFDPSPWSFQPRTHSKHS
jgi:pseudouridine-5'-monophosphatase